MNKAFNRIILLLLALLISACDQEPCVRQCDSDGEHCQRECGAGSCVDADDWGYPKVWVPAYSTGAEIFSGIDLPDGINPPINSSGATVTGTYTDQVAIPVDSNQILLNAEDIPLVISIAKRSQWTSWFGGDIINPNRSSHEPNVDDWDGGRVVPNVECKYVVTNGSSPGNIVDDLSPSTLWSTPLDCSDTFHPTLEPGRYDTETLFANCNTPCYYRYGMGLYVGLAPSNGYGKADPNDVVFTYHIPDAKSPDVANNPYISVEDNRLARGLDGYLVRGFASEQLPGAETGDRLFFKILDVFYTDNDGGYMVKIKEGTRDPRPGPMETITNTLLDPVLVVMRRIYDGIVNNQAYIQAVRGALALYIVFYAFKFMIGGVEEAKKDMFIRIIKIAVIVQLISPTSFEFFYDRLFSGFIHGTQEIAGLLLSPFDDYDPKQPWYSMDALLAKFFSAETNAKIASALISNFPLGLVAVIAVYAAMLIFVRALIKAVVIFIAGFISIAILISMAPIFMIMILFEKTRELFNEWIDQIAAFTIQIILLFAALGMFSSIIVYFLEHTFGYNVCYNVYFDFDLFGTKLTHIFDFRFWMPDISREMANIWIDADGNGVREVSPPELAYRFIDLPYFSPAYDADIIARYMREKNFLSVADLILFIGSVFLMMNFINFIPKLSDAMKGGGRGTKDSVSLFGDKKKGVGGLGLWGSTTGTAKQWLGDFGDAYNNGKKIYNSKYGKAGRQGLRQVYDETKELAKRGIKSGLKELDRLDKNSKGLGPKAQAKKLEEESTKLNHQIMVASANANDKKPPQSGAADTSKPEDKKKPQSINPATGQMEDIPDATAPHGDDTTPRNTIKEQDLTTIGSKDIYKNEFDLQEKIKKEAKEREEMEIQARESIKIKEIQDRYTQLYGNIKSLLDDTTMNAEGRKRRAVELKRELADLLKSNPQFNSIDQKTIDDLASI